MRDFFFTEGSFSYVIHAGTTSSAPVEHGAKFATIVDGTRRVLEFAATHGTPRRSYLYAADLQIWLWTILFKGASCHAYNVGSDADLSIAALAGVVSDVVNPSVKVIIAKQAAPQQPPKRYLPSIARARNELGLHQRIGLAEAINRTIECYGRQQTHTSRRRLVCSPSPPSAAVIEQPAPPKTPSPIAGDSMWHGHLPMPADPPNAHGQDARATTHLQKPPPIGTCRLLGFSKKLSSAAPGDTFLPASDMDLPIELPSPTQRHRSALNGVRRATGKNRRYAVVV